MKRQTAAARDGTTSLEGAVERRTRTGRARTGPARADRARADRTLTGRTLTGRALTGMAALVVGATGAAVVVTTPSVAQASSHREAPLISGDPTVDNTDTYAFVSPDDPNTVTLVANWLPFQEPAGGPNFYPFATDAQYDINIDNDGDAQPDITYRWTFASTYQNQNTFLYNTGPVTSLDDPDLNFRQTYKLERISGGGDDRARRRRAGRAVVRRQRVDARLPGAARPRR